MDVSILLDMVTSSNFFDKEFLDEKYQDSQGIFENETAAKVATSFNRELPSIFGRVYSSSSCGQLVSTHPLPLIKLRKQFNAPDNQSEVNNESFSSWTILSTRSLWIFFKSSRCSVSFNVGSELPPQVSCHH